MTTTASPEELFDLIYNAWDTTANEIRVWTRSLDYLRLLEPPRRSGGTSPLMWVEDLDGHQFYVDLDEVIEVEIDDEVIEYRPAVA